MNPPRIHRCAHRAWRMAAAIAALFAIPYGSAAESGCEPEERPSQPSAGEWKGYFRLIYEMRSPATPPVVIPMKWEGELRFSLGRGDVDDPPPPAPPKKNLRRPLGSPPSAGSRPNEAPPPEAPNELQQAIAQVDADYHGLYVPPGERAKLQGIASVTMEGGFGSLVPGVKFDGGVETKRALQLEILGEEDTQTTKFEEITLWGTEELSAFRGGFDAVVPGGRASGDIDFTETGGTGRTVVVDDRGRRVESNIAIGIPATSLPPGVEEPETADQRERREFDEAYDRLFGPPKDKRKMATLKVEGTDCWLLRGVVDTTALAASLEKQGLVIAVKESEWMATLDERDPAFEARVQALAAEPIPPKLTWAYIENFSERWRALRREAKSGYQRCVVKDLERKFIRLNVAALRTLVNDFPKASEGATCAVMIAALTRILPLIRVLQLYGLGDCALIEQAYATAEKEIQALVKLVLARKHTFDELDRFRVAYNSGFVDFGDQAAPYEQAWNAANAARLAGAQ